MAKPVKQSAAARTVDMFAAPTAVAAEAIEETEKLDRVPMDQDVDRMRDKAFQVQEWTTAAFGAVQAEANQYRMTRRGDIYYLETLAYVPGVAHAYGYTGVILHKKDLFNAATVIAAAARDLRDKEGK